MLCLSSKASDIMKVANPTPSSVEGMLNVMRDLKPGADQELVKFIWRGVIKEQSVLMIPPGCCVAMKAKSTSTAVRKHVVPITESAHVDLDVIAQVAPTRVSSEYVEAIRKARENGDGLTHL